MAGFNEYYTVIDYDDDRDNEDGNMDGNDELLCVWFTNKLGSLLGLRTAKFLWIPLMWS